MDESMNSVHSISAMDISPATSPKMTLNPIPSNHLLLNAFQQQQESLSNMLFSVERQIINKNPIPDDYDNNSNSLCLYTTVLTDNNIQTNPEESNQPRQRIKVEPVSTVVDSNPVINKTELKSSRKSISKLIFLIPLLFLILYIIVQHKNTSSILPRTSNWQNASEYLSKNLIGQDQGLEQFKDAMVKHKNFSIVIIEGSIGTGKTYLASSLEKFLSTTLISTNDLLGLSKHHWTEPDHLSLYLSSCLSPSLFQFLIIDDLDLLTTNEQYCQILTSALHSINKNKNLFILLLQTGKMASKCKESFDNITTKSIQFNKLQRQHIRKCIENEADTQNVQPPLNDQQIENILNSIEYINEQGILYGTTGCKQIPSLVMLASKKSSY
ncbi:unnamed protein product [Adineta steineri]|uniref:ATPase AAA-type core domain-containing protein n=1 Tax=Adineta steineri TaxID=433720 RepID=A0A813P8W4_9BILA|nr:unnamed protein product [Adineta steineri]CAF0863253.1 unnamed protein product [Adineta steineri]